jgi:hypothetical protein
MEITQRGKVQNGTLVLAEPLTLPEGAEVVVRIETLDADAAATVLLDSGDLAGLPFIGMWADRDDMNDSAAWVRRERDEWHQRALRQD